MGDQVAGGPLSKYGVNVGPMALSWAFRFANGQLESYTGRALSRAYKKQKKASREYESPEARAERRAARKAAKKAARQEAEEKRTAEEGAEAKRRKEAANQASETLFPSTANRETANLEESRKEFQKQVETFDLNDLD